MVLVMTARHEPRLFAGACLVLVVVCGCSRGQSGATTHEGPTSASTAHKPASSLATPLLATETATSTAAKQGPPEYLESSVSSPSQCDARLLRFQFQSEATDAMCNPSALPWLRQIVAAHPEFEVKAPSQPVKAFFKGRCSLYRKPDWPTHPGEVAIRMYGAFYYADDPRRDPAGHVMMYGEFCDRATCERLAATWEAIVPSRPGGRCHDAEVDAKRDLLALGPWQLPEALPEAKDLVSACARVTACWMRQGGAKSERDHLCAALSDGQLASCARQATCEAVKRCTEQHKTRPDAATIKRRRRLYPWPPPGP